MTTETMKRSPLLKELEGLTACLVIQAGEPVFVTSPSITLRLQPELDEDHELIYSGMVFAELPTPHELIGVAWQLVDSQDTIVDEGNTGCYGDFLIRLPPQSLESRAKFRLQMGSQVSVIQPPRDPNAVHQQVPRRPIWEVWLPLSRTMSFNSKSYRRLRIGHTLVKVLSRAMGFNSKSDRSWPKDQTWGLSQDLRYVVIDCPMTSGKAEAFPNGVVLLQYLGEDDRVLKEALIPVSANRTLRRFQGDLPLTALSIDPKVCDPGRLVIWEIGDQDLELGRFNELISAAMVEAVMETPLVRSSPDLKQRIAQLTTKLKGLRGHHE